MTHLMSSGASFTPADCGDINKSYDRAWDTEKDAPGDLLPRNLQADHWDDAEGLARLILEERAELEYALWRTGCPAEAGEYTAEELHPGCSFAPSAAYLRSTVE